MLQATLRIPVAVIVCTDSDPCVWKEINGLQLTCKYLFSLEHILPPRQALPPALSVELPCPQFMGCNYFCIS